MTTQTFEEFAAGARAEGFDEALERQWPAGTFLDTHTHDFSVKVVIRQGEMVLTVGDDVRRLLPGDSFTLERQIPHSERYGPDGATYWVARRNAA
jgi:mannose-6-phosphate isomerase-like protein (cupin superfamily)